MSEGAKSLRLPYHVKCSPNCMIRAENHGGVTAPENRDPRAPLMTPKVGLPNNVPGGPYLVVFVTLKTSQINLIPYLSLNLLFFETDKSKFLKSGAVRMPVPKLPTWPNAGTRTA